MFCACIRPRYQMSVSRTIGPLVLLYYIMIKICDIFLAILNVKVIGVAVGTVIQNDIPFLVHTCAIVVLLELVLKPFLTHLSRRLIGEYSSIPMLLRPSTSVVHNIKTSSKALGQSKSNFVWSRHR